jgi:hypothetical protein
MVGWVIAKTSGQKASLLRKKSPPLTGLELERAAAGVFGRTNTWAALRDVAGLDPSRLPESARGQYVEEQALEWAARFVDEHPALGLDKERFMMRVRLNFIDKTGIFKGTNALRSSAEYYARDGEVRELQYGARMGGESVAAVARSLATLDVASLILGNEDAQIAEERIRIERESADLVEMIERVRPLLEEHGLGADWLPER